jgi:uncharacterized protein (TIGR02466 family)
MLEPTLLKLWPTPVYITTLESLNDSHIQAFKSQEFEEMASKNGFYSKSKNVLDQPLFSQLQTEVGNHLRIFSNNFLELDNQLTYKMINSWVLQLNKGNKAEPHTHANSVFSGVFYLEDASEADGIVFHKNYDNLFSNSILPNNTNWNYLNSQRWQIQPKKGLVILFPSLLKHSVPQATSTRYSVAFNYFVKGTLGENENVLEL